MILLISLGGSSPRNSSSSCTDLLIFCSDFFFFSSSSSKTFSLSFGFRGTSYFSFGGNFSSSNRSHGIFVRDAAVLKTLDQLDERLDVLLDIWGIFEGLKIRIVIIAACIKS